MQVKGSGRLVAAASILVLGAGAVWAKGGTAKPTPQPPPTPTPTPTLVQPVPAPTPPRVLTGPGTTADANNHQFDVTGFIQKFIPPAGACSTDGAGSVLINGTEITIPCNMIVQMPANTKQWSEFINTVSANSPPAALDLAYDLATTVGKSAAANPSFELRLVGNIVNGKYIAALGYASQQSANTGSGVITNVDLSTGRLVVTSNNGRTVELEINTPAGIYGRAPATGLDDRLSADEANPTITASTGFPMCVPRFSDKDDPDCPMKNRPKSVCRDFITNVGITPRTGGAGRFFNGGLNGANGSTFCTSFVMKAPMGTVTDATTNYPPADAIAGAGDPDATKMAPLVAGDFITWSGSLLQGKKDGNSNDIFSVHTITANVGIFTQPGTLPVYVRIGEFGIAGDNAAFTLSNANIPQEVQNRLALEADVTDITAIVDVYLVDWKKDGAGKYTIDQSRWVTPFSMTSRTLSGTDVNKNTAIGFGGSGSIPKPRGFDIEGGIVTQFDGAQVGRARIRATKATAGVLTSPTRTVRVVARTLCNPNEINVKPANNPPTGWIKINADDPKVPGLTPDTTTCLGRATTSLGIKSGQYEAPVFEFIFPENTGRGDPVVSNNFWDLNFLAGDKDAPGPLVPQPW